MRQKQDPWHKPRGNGNHFTDGEIAVIKQAFMAERPAAVVAAQLKCSQRSVNRYFEKLRAGSPLRKDTRKAVPVAATKRAPVDRFYRGNFEL